MKRARSPSPSPSTCKTDSLMPMLLPIRMMLALPASGVVLPPLVGFERAVKEPLLQAELLHNVASRLVLSEDEEALVGALDAVLEDELEDIAVFCVDSRVTDAQIEAHAFEIGTSAPLKPNMKAGVRRFVQFMLLLQRLQVVCFEGRLCSRTLLGIETVIVHDAFKWRAVLTQTCIAGYFSSLFLIYDYWLMFGWCAAKKGYRFPRPKDVVLKSSDKKIAVLFYNSKWIFNTRTLERNVKQYTQAHMRIRAGGAAVGLKGEAARARIVSMLLDAARAAT